MQTEIEHLRPTGPGYSLPETLAAVTAIEAAWQTLNKTRDGVLAAVKAVYIPEMQNRPGAKNLDEQIRKLWTRFLRVDAPKFHAVRAVAAGNAVAALERFLSDMERGAVARIDRLGTALGRILDDPEAGRDLGLLLSRMGGGFVDCRSFDCATRALLDWRSARDASERMAHAPESAANDPDTLRPVAINKLMTALDASATKED